MGYLKSKIKQLGFNCKKAELLDDGTCIIDASALEDILDRIEQVNATVEVIERWHDGDISTESALYQIDEINERGGLV
jgi:hypothetical protein